VNDLAMDCLIRSTLVQLDHVMYYKRSRSNVKGQGHSLKTCLIAKLLLYFRKSGSLNLMAMSEL